MAKVKRYHKVFRTYSDARNFRLPPNMQRVSIVEQHYRIGKGFNEETRCRYFINYMETHIHPTPYPNSGIMGSNVI